MLKTRNADVIITYGLVLSFIIDEMGDQEKESMKACFLPRLRMEGGRTCS